MDRNPPPRLLPLATCPNSKPFCVPVPYSRGLPRGAGRLEPRSANLDLLQMETSGRLQHCPATTCQPRVDALNAAIATWASSNSTSESVVTAVDVFTGYDDATDTVDGVHAARLGLDQAIEQLVRGAGPAVLRSS